MVKNPPANARDIGDASSIPGWGKIPWSRTRHPTLVFLPGKSHGYSPWGGEGSDTTEHTHTPGIDSRDHGKTKTVPRMGFR